MHKRLTQAQKNDVLALLTQGKNDHDVAHDQVYRYRRHCEANGKLEARAGRRSVGGNGDLNFDTLKPEQKIKLAVAFINTASRVEALETEVQRLQRHIGSLGQELHQARRESDVWRDKYYEYVNRVQQGEISIGQSN